MTVGVVGAVLTDLAPDPCREFRDGEFLNYIYIICERSSDLQASWQILLQCNATLEEFLSYLQNITIVLDNVEVVSMQLANATNLFDTAGSITSLMQTAALVNDITNVNSDSQEVTGNVTIIISNVLSGEDDVLIESFVNGTTKILIEAFEKQLQQVNIDTNGNYSQGSENIIVMINEGEPAMVDGFGIAVMATESEDTEDKAFGEFMVLDLNNEFESVLNQSSNLLLYPAQISESFLPTDSARIANIVYRRPNLFSSRHYRDINNEFSKYQRRLKRRLVPNTVVISSTLYRNGDKILIWNRSPGSGNENNTFRQWYRQLEVDGKRAKLETSVCSFWNFRADGGRGNWSTDGCRLVSTDLNGLINCECTHLTNFAVLMDVFDGDSLTEIQILILDAATIFGCGASILGLMITVLAFSTDSNLRSKRPNQILLGLSTVLIGLYVTFLFMVLLDSERKRAFLNDLPCNIMAGLVHFFLLSALAWMTVESFMMFHLFVRVFGPPLQNFIPKAIAFTTVVPLTIVGATYGITTLAGGEYARKDVCFVSAPWPILGGVLVPIFFMLTFNTVIYFRIMVKLNTPVPGKTYTNSQQKRERRKRIQHAVSILLLLGLTWGLGYFCYIPVGDIPSFIFQMLFVTFNSTQGYLIFMLYCMRNPTFRKRWRKLCFICPDRPLTSSFVSKISNKKSKELKVSSGNFRPSSVPVSSVEKRRFERT